MRFQSTWPSKDIFHEYALDFGKRVNDMTGGDLKIEVLPAGAVVPAFQLLDAVSKGVLDGGHGVLVYHYGKNTALALWGSGPAYAHGRQHAARLAQVRRRQGAAREDLRRRSAPTWCRSLMRRSTRSRSAGSRSRSQSVDDFKGLKYRTVGISIDLFTAMGAAVNALPGGEIVAAIDRGLLDAAEFNNASSDRALGFADVSKICMLQSYHQNSEQLEISFNKDKFKGLPPKMQALIESAVEAASQDMQWKAIDRNSQDYITLQTQDKVRFFKTPDAILKRSSSSSTTRSPRNTSRTIRCSRRSSSRSSTSPSARRAGSRTTSSAARWRSITTSGRTPSRRSDGT